MYIFDISNPFTLLAVLIVTILAVFLGKEIKKPHVPAATLIVFLILIIVYTVQLMLLTEEMKELYHLTLIRCIGINFVMIFLSFVSYLWIDDIACRDNKKKSVDNSLDWFWNKV